MHEDEHEDEHEGDGDESGEASDDVRFWRNHLHAGLALYLAGTLVGAAYLHLTPDGPSRAVLWQMVGFGGLSVAAFALAPRNRIVRSRHRVSFFVSWSLFTIVFTSVITTLDGGLDSPLALLIVMPVLYAALAYSVPWVAAIAGAGIVASTIVAAVAGDPTGAAITFVGALGMVGSAATFAASQREQQSSRLLQLATSDGLTGCLNHRSFYARLETEIAKARATDGELSLLLIDLDEFKAVNDRHGHLAGDRVLRDVGQAMFAMTRSHDVVGRVGGDEFAVLLTGTSSHVATVIAERLSDDLANSTGPVQITASVGVASTGPYRRMTAAELVAEADQALYGAKPRRGRLSAVD